MSNSFFDKKEQGLQVYGRLLQQNEINARKARIFQAYQALQQLKQDIDTRCEKLQNIFSFLDSKQALYQQLFEQYQQNPTTSLSTRLSKLGQAISELLANLETTQPEKVIADLGCRYEELKAELARKVDLINRNSEPAPENELIAGYR